MVNDLNEAVFTAEEFGATKADMQYVPGMVTMKDPAGHPFCLIPLPKKGLLGGKVLALERV